MEEGVSIYLVSDSNLDTAENIASIAAAHFDTFIGKIKKYPYVGDKNQIEEIVIEASNDANSIIIHTMVVSELKDYLQKKAEKFGIKIVDVMRPVMDAIEDSTGLSPHTNLMKDSKEDYLKKTEVIEFAVKYDDGKDAMGILLADVVVIGVSRTSKTPLCMYLAHKYIKAANLPLVPEIEPPQELFEINPKKIFGLTIDPDVLVKIRKERLKSLGLDANAIYASEERVKKEVKYAEGVMKKLGCTVIDVTNKAVEETANVILNVLKGGETV
ncbi:putative pyruvate, phosphate dikinase regulatory protein [Thermoanaerobacter kivui]|uniref:Putative pyruvate, phosphate dikinase regulatory protein n=1 Tax=Thermoanaerobacter kivui TaxID=2325 RepID=A0A097AQV1_THEKI|nr:pyruvate, water dikinase regulatory protein [Thermoanaerobacter kivui]AIS52192.1 putative pyruvate, phosphate dikinase regulatory protein [Thermoanaerobacter kivui]